MVEARCGGGRGASREKVVTQARTVSTVVVSACLESTDVLRCMIQHRCLAAAIGVHVHTRSMRGDVKASSFGIDVSSQQGTWNGLSVFGINSSLILCKHMNSTKLCERESPLCPRPAFYVNGDTSAQMSRRGVPSDVAPSPALDAGPIAHAHPTPHPTRCVVPHAHAA
jgi:hypothetical protein